MTDEQKAERKTLIANNKAWEAAEVVRREWLTSFFARKTLPKDALLVTATLLTTTRREIADAVNHGNTLAADLLGIDGHDDYRTNRLATYLDTHPTKAAHVALAVVIGGVESSTSRDTWRRPNAEAAKYLNIIAGWGYALSPVEKIAAMIDEETTGE
jgi:ParB family chromosome partitioning protein